MSSQSNTVHPLVRDFVIALNERYTDAAARVGGPVYTELARLSAKIVDALSSSNPVGELRALAWETPSSGVGEVVTRVAALLEGAGR